LRFQGLVYRAHNPRWSFEPNSGEGARLFGGRFNAKGRAAFYTSLRVETAWLEAQQGLAFKAQPMTMCAYEVDCTELLDLTDPAIRASHDISDADLACAWEDLASRRQPVPSWALAERLIAAGIAGIKVASFAFRARPDDINLVFWRWGDAAPHGVRVVDPLGRLPRNDSSWR
jgi:RES domain-containing protein